MPDRLDPPAINPALPPETRVVFKGREYRPGDVFEYQGNACEVLEFMRTAYDQITAQYPDRKWQLGDDPGPWQTLCMIQSGIDDALRDLRDTLRLDPDDPVPLPSASPLDAAEVADDADSLAGPSRAQTVVPGPFDPGAREQQPPATPARALHDPLAPSTEDELADDLAGRGFSPDEVADHVDRARRGDAPQGERHPFRSGDESAESAAVAEPVKLFTGEFVLEETDLHVPGRGLDFTLTRTYASGRPAYGPFGFNWDHNWNVYCRELADGSVGLWNGRLHEDVYTPDAAGGFAPPTAVFAILRQTLGGGGIITGYELTFRGGLIWRFSRPDGYPDPERIPLTAVEDRFGNRITCEYDARGRLSLVYDTIDRVIRFDYGDCGRLEAVHDFAGRTVRYFHTDDTEHLARVISPSTGGAPDGQHTSYEYVEPATHPLLRHSIIRVLDSLDRVVVENTYQNDPSSDEFGRVIEQTYLGQEYRYSYQRLGYVVPAPELVNNAVMRVCLSEPSCPLRLYTFSMRGELLDERYRLSADRSFRIWASTYRYDEYGNIVEIRRPDGLALRYTWDSGNADPRARGNLIRVQLAAPKHRPQPARAVLAIAYEPRFQQVKTVTDEAGNTTTYTYDYEIDALGAGSGLLIRLKHPDATLPDGTIQNAEERMTYDANGLLETWRSADGRERRIVRGSDGQPTRVTLGAGTSAHTQEYAYDFLGRLTSTTSATGRRITTTYDAMGNVSRVERERVNGHCGLVSFHRDKAGHLQEQRTPIGDYRDDRLTDPFITTAFNLDPLAQAWTITEASNTIEPRTWRYERDCTGTGIRSIVDPIGRSTTVISDERGLILRQTLADSINAKSSSSFRYDRNGNLLRFTDPCGRVTDFRYDAWGRLIEKRLPGVGGERTSVFIEYGPMDRIVRIRVDGVTAPGQPPSVLQQIEQEFDERGRLVRRRQGPLSVRLWHDRDGFLERIVDERGRELTATRDSASRVVTSTDALGNQILFEYDPDGDLVAIVHRELPTGGAPAEEFRTTFEYDRRGRLRHLIDALGNRHTADYDDRDLPRTVIPPAASPVSLHFDAVGALVRSTSSAPAGLATSIWRRDKVGRVIGHVSPEGSETTYSYGLHDRWNRIVLPSGAHRIRHYDPAGELVREETPSGAAIAIFRGGDGQVGRVTFAAPPGAVGLPDLLIERDGLTRAVQMIQGSEDLRIAYDELGRLTEETRAGRSLRWSHDDATSSADLTYPDGRTDHFEFDALGRPVRVTLAQTGSAGLVGPGLSPDSLIASHEYVGPERLRTRTLGDGTVTTFGYDAGGRLASLVHEDQAANLIAETRYVYDAASRRRASLATPLPGTPQLAIFDALGRLQRVVEGFAVPFLPPLATQAQQDAFIATAAASTGGAEATYAFDDGDFLAQETLVPGQLVRRWQKGDVGQPTSLEVTGPGGVTNQPFTHDDDGNRLSDDRHQYRYDALGRLREVTGPAGLLLEIDYDPLGRVMERRTATRTDRIWHLGPRALYQEDGSGTATVQRTYATRLDDLVLHADGGNRWAHHDARMSLVAMTDDSGVPIERYAYSPWGQWRIFAPDGTTVRPVSSFDIQPIFGGHEALSLPYLYDARARCYDADSMRFLQPDSRGFVDSHNLYSYCGLDPVNHMDPSGNVLPIIAAFVIVGALAGAGYSVWDASEHPERYSGDFSWRALFQVFGGAAIGAAAGATAHGVVALAGGSAAAGGGATGVASLTALQKFVLGGTASALSMYVWRSGFNGVFPEYADPPSVGNMALDYMTGGLLGPFTMQNPSALLQNTTRGSFAPRAFSNNWRLLLNPRTKYTLGNLFQEARVGREGFNLVSQQYWRASGGAEGKALHHLWIQQQTNLPSWLKPLQNAGINLLEIGGPLNSWMGGHLLREWGFRSAVASALAVVGYGSYAATSDLLYGESQDSPWPNPEGIADPEAATISGSRVPEPTLGDQGAAPTASSAPKKLEP